MDGYFESDVYDDFEELDALDEYDELDAWEEDDEFLGRAWGWLTRPGSRQRRVALGAARGALGAIPGIAGSAAKRLTGGSWWGEPVASGIGQVISGGLSQLLPQQMDHYADLAAEAEDEAEAEAFLGALIPLAARLLPQAGAAIMRVAPHLIRGVSNVARQVHANPAARQMLGTMGTVVRRTGMDIARQAASGRPVTAQGAVRQLARNTYRVMGDPRQRQRVAHRSRRRALRQPCPSYAQ